MAFIGKKPIDVVDATTAQTLEVTTALEVDTIKDTGGTTAIEIDSDGVVTLPATPAWRLELDGEAYTSAGTKEVLLDTVVDSESTDHRRFMQGGIALADSNRAISIPKTGIYQINANARMDGIGSGYVIFYIRVNDSTTSDPYDISGVPSSNYEGFMLSQTLYLRENDTVGLEFYISSDTSTSVVASAGYFSGHLVG